MPVANCWLYDEVVASLCLWFPGAFRLLSLDPRCLRLSPLFTVLHAVLVFFVAVLVGGIWGRWFNFWEGSSRLVFAVVVLLAASCFCPTCHGVGSGFSLQWPLSGKCHHIPSHSSLPTFFVFIQLSKLLSYPTHVCRLGFNAFYLAATSLLLPCSMLWSSEAAVLVATVKQSWSCMLGFAFPAPLSCFCMQDWGHSWQQHPRRWLPMITSSASAMAEDLEWGKNRQQLVQWRRPNPSHVLLLFHHLLHMLSTITTTRKTKRACSARWADSRQTNAASYREAGRETEEWCGSPRDFYCVICIVISLNSY